MCFEMEAQSSGGDIGPECLQSNDSYSLDAFGDIDGLIAYLLEFATTPPHTTEWQNSRTIERRCFRSCFDVGEYRW